MLEIDSRISDLIQYSRNGNSNIVTFTLVKINFSDVALLTDAPRDITITINGENRTYSADSTLKAVSPPKAQIEVNRDLFDITITDPYFSYAATLASASTGIRTEIHVGFLDSDGSLIEAALPIYTGQISSWSSSVSKDNNEPIVIITSSGPLTKLRQITDRLTTADSQKAIYLNDTCFDYSFDTDNEATIRWGPGE